MFFTRQKPGDVIVVKVGDVQTRLFIFPSRRRKGRLLIGIQAPESVIIGREHFQLPEDQIAS